MIWDARWEHWCHVTVVNLIFWILMGIIIFSTSGIEENFDSLKMTHVLHDILIGLIQKRCNYIANTLEHLNIRHPAQVKILSMPIRVIMPLISLVNILFDLLIIMAWNIESGQNRKAIWLVDSHHRGQWHKWQWHLINAMWSQITMK